MEYKKIAFLLHVFMYSLFAVRVRLPHSIYDVVKHNFPFYVYSYFIIRSECKWISAWKALAYILCMCWNVSFCVYMIHGDCYWNNGPTGKRRKRKEKWVEMSPCQLWFIRRGGKMATRTQSLLPLSNIHTKNVSHFI